MADKTVGHEDEESRLKEAARLVVDVDSDAARDFVRQIVVQSGTDEMKPTTVEESNIVFDLEREYARAKLVDTAPLEVQPRSLAAEVGGSAWGRYLLGGRKAPDAVPFAARFGRVSALSADGEALHNVGVWFGVQAAGGVEGYYADLASFESDGDADDYLRGLREDMSQGGAQLSDVPGFAEFLRTEQGLPGVWKLKEGDVQRLSREAQALPRRVSAPIAEDLEDPAQLFGEAGLPEEQALQDEYLERYRAWTRGLGDSDERLQSLLSASARRDQISSGFTVLEQRGVDGRVLGYDVMYGELDGGPDQQALRSRFLRVGYFAGQAGRQNAVALRDELTGMVESGNVEDFEAADFAAFVAGEEGLPQEWRQGPEPGRWMGLPGGFGELDADEQSEVVDARFDEALRLGGVAYGAIELGRDVDKALAAAGLASVKFDPGVPAYYDQATGMGYWLGVHQVNVADATKSTAGIVQMGRDPDTGRMMLSFAAVSQGNVKDMESICHTLWGKLDAERKGPDPLGELFKRGQEIAVQSGLAQELEKRRSQVFATPGQVLAFENVTSNLAAASVADLDIAL